MHSLYIFDGSNLAFRAFCAYPSLTIDDFPVGAIYGTIRILTTFVKEWQPGKILIPFDIDKSEYRKGIYPAYKDTAGREESRIKKLKEEFGSQLDITLQLLEKFGVTTLYEQNRKIEADDVIAYLVDCYKQGQFSDIKRVVIMSSDKDLCALVAPDPFKVHWFDPIRKDLVTAENFQKKFGVTIEQFPDYKALKGDQSDNIPHPKGIGPAGAVKLLSTYGSLDHLLAIKHEKIEPYRKVVELGRKLVALNLHQTQPELPNWQQIQQRIHQPQSISEGLEDMLNSLSFQSILENWEEMLPRWQAFADCRLGCLS